MHVTFPVLVCSMPEWEGLFPNIFYATNRLLHSLFATANVEGACYSKPPATKE